MVQVSTAEINAQFDCLELRIFNGSPWIYIHSGLVSSVCNFPSRQYYGLMKGTSTYFSAEMDLTEKWAHPAVLFFI